MLVSSAVRQVGTVVGSTEKNGWIRTDPYCAANAVGSEVMHAPPTPAAFASATGVATWLGDSSG